jgi:hypothetical protein
MKPADEWPSPRVTAEALLALRHVKHEHPVKDLCSDIIDWLMVQKKRGGWPIVAGFDDVAPDVLTTASVVEALEAHGHDRVARDAALCALRLLGGGANASGNPWEEIGLLRLRQEVGGCGDLPEDTLDSWFYEAGKFAAPWFRADRLLCFEAYRLQGFRQKLSERLIERLVGGPSGNEVHEAMLHAVGLMPAPDTDRKATVVRPTFLAPPGIYLGARALFNACLLEGAFSALGRDGPVLAESPSGSD